MAYPTSTSGRSIISLSTTVPASNSRQSIISLGSSTSSSHYETCPADSPPPLRQRWPTDPSSLPPLPRPPALGSSNESLEGAFSGLAVGQGHARVHGSRHQEERVSSREQSDKPLPRLPSRQPDPVSPVRQDPSSSRYRAGSSFTTVYDPEIVPRNGRTPSQTSSAHPEGSRGAVDLVLRRRDRDSRETTTTPVVWTASVGSGDRSQGSHRAGWTDRPSSTSHLPYSDQPSCSSHAYAPRPPQSALDPHLVPMSPQPPQQPQTYDSGASAPGYAPPLQPPYARQEAVSFPSHHPETPYQPSEGRPSARPPPPPNLTYRPYTSPPAFPRTQPSHPSSSPFANTPPRQRELSFSLLPPISSPSNAQQHRPTSSQYLNHHHHPPSPSTPRPRAQSATPATPSSGNKAADTRVQCSGRNKSDGRRCGKRRGLKNVAGGSPSPRKLGSVGVGESDENGEEEWYCHLHETAILASNEGSYLGRAGWVEFNDWLRPELDDPTKIALMKLMSRLPSSSSSAERGYIYCFEYRSLGTSSYRTFKVGSSKNPLLRLDQWTTQCASHRPVLLGIVPSDSSTQVPLRGVAGDGGEGLEGRGGVKASLWLEKLVQTEIQSLDPGTRTRVLCADCSKFHQELFRVPRAGDTKDEWEDVVKPAMERWGRFVEMVMGD